MNIRELHEIRESHDFDILIQINGEMYELEKSGGLFFDYESDELLTGEQLKKEFERLKSSGDTECDTFSDYIDSCCDGSLMPVKWGVKI